MEDRFRLSKHYADGVDAEGNAFIAYAGEVAWGPLSVPLCGLSVFPRSGVESTRWRPGAVRLREDAGRFGLAGGGWEVEAEPLQPAFGETLWRSERGGVEWSCLVPAGSMRVRSREASLQAYGYAERIDLTVAPWDLPIETLLWGRFVNAEESLTWIEWRGPRPLRRVWWNGRSCEVSSISLDGIETAEGIRLEIAGERSLRDGPIAGLLAGIKPLASILPSLARMRERKLLGRGSLIVEGQRRQGWVIHEEVTLR